MRSATARSPAKVNLVLSVGPVQPDGFHPVATVYQAVGLYDEVTATAAAGSGVTVTAQGNGAALVPTDGTNLVARAAGMLASRFDIDAGVDLRLVKAIPVAAGLAGGSTDAAAALLACDAVWGTEASRQELSEIAARLGSDVAFCLLGGTAMGLGRGERLNRVLATGTYEWVLAFAERGLATGSVYAEYDRQPPIAGSPGVPDTLMTALRRGDPDALGAELSNDLQEAAIRLRPRLRMTLAVGRDLGALGAVVSGSGPTCAFLARDADHALNLAARLSSAGVCRSVSRAAAPAPGARLV